MPFKSKAQRNYLYANHPDIAKRWEKETTGSLPSRVGSKKKNKPLTQRRRKRKIKK